MNLVLVFSILLIQACGGGSSSGDEGEAPPAEVSLTTKTSVVVTGQLAIAGKEESKTETLFDNQLVELEDSRGQVVGQGYSDKKGNYSIQTSTLNIPTAQLRLASAEFTITSLLDLDDEGKIFGIRQGIELDTSKLLEGTYNAGSTPFLEVAAIKGQVKFVNPDGTENTKIAKIGTDVYLPGYSFFAKTDKDGKFNIIYIPAGTYTLRIEKNFFFKEQEITLAENTTLNLGELSVQTDTDAPITTASKDSTDFRNSMCVSLSSNETVSTYFTRDGSNPTVSETFKYPPTLSSCGSTSNCPICITSSTTLKYFSVDTAGNIEDVRVNFYFYNAKWSDPSDTTAPSTTITVNGVTLSSSETLLTGSASVTLSSNEGATIYYTTDGSTPTTSSLVFDFALDITQTTTIKFFAVDYASNVESVQTKSINILDWHSISYSGSPPKSQADYNSRKGMIYDASRDQILFYCHQDSSSTNCGTWKYASGTWTNLSATALTVQVNALGYNSSSGETFMFVYPSGSGGSSFVTYKFNHTSNAWDTVSTTNTPTSSSTVNGIAATFDSSSGVFLVAISIPSAIYTYSFNSSTGAYSLLATSTGTSTAPISFYRLAYDPSRSRAVAFGRIPPTAGSGQSFIGVTYEYYSSAWNAVVTNEVPTFETLVYDTRRSLVFGFAADNQDTANNESWHFTGSDWVKASPPLTRPRARKSPFVVYDTTNKKVVVFGGSDRFGQLLSDMWEYRP